MPRLGLFRAEQHGVLIAGCIGRVAENLAGIVDCDGVKPVPVGISVLRLTNPLAVEVMGTCFPTLKGL
jgi:hypothetical protein